MIFTKERLWNGWLSARLFVFANGALTQRPVFVAAVVAVVAPKQPPPLLSSLQLSLSRPAF